MKMKESVKLSAAADARETANRCAVVNSNSASSTSRVLVSRCSSFNDSVS
jgi:hypothetical protein